MLTLYTINTCDTCRKARRALDAQGVGYRVHDLRRDGLPDALLEHIFARVTLAEAINKRSKTWRELSAAEQQTLEASSLAKFTFNDGAHKLLQAYPTLLKRPLLAVDATTLRIGYKDGDYDSL